jgi:hypothetical protein
VKFGAVVLSLGSASLLLAQGIGGVGGGGGGFGGPSIQGRGGQGNRRQSDGLRIRPFVGVQAIYDSGLTSITPGQGGEVFTRGAAGVEVIGGVYGTKEWKRNQLQLSYTGDYRHYNNFQFWNGTDQSLGLNYATVLTKRLTFEGTLNGGTTNRAFGSVYTTPNAIDALGQPGLPINSLFDVRTNYGSANGTMIYSFSPRTSMSFSGGGYLVRRQSSVLAGVAGVQARGDIVRRISRRTSVGMEYTFLTFQFNRAFGDSYIHGLSLFAARQIGRRWELNVRAGALKVETLGTRQVQVDPAIAAITGVSTWEEVNYRNVFLGSGSVGLTRTSRSGNLGFMFSRSINPGNGLLLTSQADQASVYFTRRLSRRLNFDMSYGYNRLRGLMLVSGDFQNHVGGVGLGWQVSRYTQLTARYDRRNSLTTFANSYSLNGNRFALGIMFTPADIPFSLW